MPRASAHPGAFGSHAMHKTRSGRVGNSGAAHTLLTADDAKLAAELLGVLRGAGQPVPPELESLAQRAPRRRKVRRRRKGKGLKYNALGANEHEHEHERGEDRHEEE